MKSHAFLPTAVGPDAVFDPVKPLDGGQRTGGEGLAELEGLVELAPRVRPTGYAQDAWFVVGERLMK